MVPGWTLTARLRTLMKTTISRTSPLILITAFGLTWLGMSSLPLPAQEPAAPATEEAAPTLPPDQLDSLVAPIALYPDPLVAQVLAASTYPLEVVQLGQWMAKNPTLKDKALAEAVA